MYLTTIYCKDDATAARIEEELLTNGPKMEDVVSFASSDNFARSRKACVVVHTKTMMTVRILMGRYLPETDVLSIEVMEGA